MKAYEIEQIPWKPREPGYFFAEKNPFLEELIGSYLSHFKERIPSFIKNQVDAIALGGSYGRGEAGLIHKDPLSSSQLSEPVKIFIFFKKDRTADLNQWVEEEQLLGKHALTVTVSFHCFPTKALMYEKGRLVFYNLIYGHKLLYGPSCFFQSYREFYPQGRLAEGEASRLLWNAGTELYFAQKALEKKKDALWVRQIHEDLKLSLGDSLTISHHYYSPLAKARHATLLEIPLPYTWGSSVTALHREGLAFKLYPHYDALSWKNLQRENKLLRDLWEKVFLYLEEKRLGRPFISLLEYAKETARLFPEIPWKVNVGVAFYELLKRHSCLKPIFDTPRASLFKTLAALLSQEKEGEMLSFRHFFPKPKNNQELLLRYKQAWKRYS